MPATRSRRIVRRAVMALAVAMLLPVWYVGSWLIVSKAANSGVISYKAALVIHPAFEPLNAYCLLGMPGSESLYHLWWSVNRNAGQVVYVLAPPRPPSLTR